MLLSRRLVLGSSAVVLAAGLVGCGGPSAPPDAAPASAAPASTSAAATPTPSPTPTTVIELTADTIADVMSSAAASATSCTFTIDATQDGEETTGDGAVRTAADGSSELQLRMAAAGMSVEFRVVDGTWYVNAGDATQGKFVTGDPADPDGPFAGMAGVFDSVSPNKGFAVFAGAVISVTPVGGTELIGGVPTQAYDIVLDTARLTDEVRAEQFDDTAPLPMQVSFRYWFGADGLVRRMEADIQGQQQVMTFSQWGEPVDIQAPSPAEVIDLG